MPTVFADLLTKYPDDADAHRRFERKPNGGFRPITVPNKSLKKWHRAVLAELEKRKPTWPNYVHGGVKRHSYVTFAQKHVDQRHVITVDISKCFDSITGDEVAAALQKHIGVSKQASEELAFALCFNDRLAQGFPTSSFICNLYLSDQMDILQKNFDSQGLRFGSFVDDIAVSGVITHPNDVINDIATSLSHARLKMKKAKVHVMPSSVRQVICGLIVNKRLAVSSELEQQLHYDIKKGDMPSRVAEGWVANLNSFDPVLSKKLFDHAVRCGVIKIKAKTS
jgi:RNA-directed DNA polymerase